MIDRYTKRTLLHLTKHPGVSVIPALPAYNGEDPSVRHLWLAFDAFAESIVNARAYFTPMRRRSRGHSAAVITILMASPGRKGSIPAHRSPETLIPLPI